MFLSTNGSHYNSSGTAPRGQETGRQAAWNLLEETHLTISTIICKEFYEEMVKILRTTWYTMGTLYDHLHDIYEGVYFLRMIRTDCTV